MITISICMIVKDEEAHLARCLDSLAGIAEEIIIVDTGSTDHTVEIAKTYTDQVYSFEWVDDFSKARNYCISKATKEYIYVADADEVLDQENKERFMTLKQVLLPEIDIVQMRYGNQMEFNTVYNYDEEYRPKLFKRVREFYYVDPVHETLQIEPVVYDSDVVITHKPHESHAKRDFASFQKAVTRGERLGKRILSMYAKELFIAGDEEDFREASAYFEQAFVEEGRSPEEITDILCVLTRCARIKGDIVSFFKYAMKAMVSAPCSEICCELGEFYYGQQDYQEAYVWFYNAIHETQASLSLEYQQERPEKRMSDCCEK